MTLTEFLLARITEDEALWLEVPEGAALKVQWVDPLRQAVLMSKEGAVLTRARVLAECEAKRRIVSAWRSGFPEEDRYAIGWHDLHVQALAWLAAPYADHPDFDPDWRVS